MTLTSGTLDVRRIYRHLTEEIGFWEVGFAPVTTSPERDYAIADDGFDTLLGQFRELAEEFLEAARRRTATTASRTSGRRSRRFTRA